MDNPRVSDVLEPNETESERSSERSLDRSLERRNMALYLYVLLDRIGEVEGCVWDEMDMKHQLNCFKKLFEKLKRDCGNNYTLKNVLTSDALLNDSLTEKHRKYENHEVTSTCLNPKPIYGETLIHRAISLLSPNNGNESQMQSQSPTVSKLRNIEDVVRYLITEASFLLICDRKKNKRYDGQTPLHLAILKQRQWLVQRIVETIKSMKEKKYLEVVAKGTAFTKTAMMAGTPLCVAALTLNLEILKYLTENTKLDGQNDLGDNVYHSLVKYAYFYRDKMEKILEMMDYIAQYKWLERNQELSDKTKVKTTKKEKEPVDKKRKKRKTKEKEALKLWMMGNNANLNPLQLAARLGLYEVFNHIIHYEVYCSTNDRDGLFDIKTYDITDIETEPERKTEITSEEDMQCCSTEKNKNNAIINENTKKRFPLLQTVLHHQPKSALFFIEIKPVRAIINKKWNKYRLMFWFWGFVHLSFMSLLTWCAVERSILQNSTFESGNNSISDPPKFNKVVSLNSADAFVTSMCVIGLLFGVLYIGLQVISWRRYFQNTESKVMNNLALLGNPYSNTIHRLFLIVFSILLIMDFFFAIALESYENYCLMFALIIGWYLILFFLQAFKTLSFFTALIQMVVLDMLKLFLFMGVLLVAFSTAMFMIMQGANTDEETFLDYGQTLVKMLMIMLGLGEIDVLFQARHPALAIFVFIMFVLLTTILLLNALIAMMSKTCTELMSDQGNITAQEMHYSLHKLSVVLVMESILPKRWYKVVGEARPSNRFIKDKWYPEINRLFWTNLNIKSEKGADEDEFDPISTGNTHSFNRNATAPFTLNRAHGQEQQDSPRTNKDQETSQKTLTMFNGQEPQHSRTISQSVTITDMRRSNCSNCDGTVTHEHVTNEHVLNS